MPVEVQFRIAPTGAADPLDGTIVSVRNLSQTIPFAEYEQWIINDIIPPSIDLSLLTEQERTLQKRYKKGFLFWLAPGLDHAAAAALSGRHYVLQFLFHALASGYSFSFM